MGVIDGPIGRRRNAFGRRVMAVDGREDAWEEC